LRYTPDTFNFEKNIPPLVRWNEHAFEVPDVVAFKDFEHCKQEVARNLESHLPNPPPSDLLIFPYPNTPKKLRRLAVLQPEDLTVLRTAAGQIIRVTDRLLSPRVLAYRLGDLNPCWQFRESKFGWREFTDYGEELLRGGEYGGLCRLDVRSYYASISIARLAEILNRVGCDRKAASLLLSFLDAWQVAHPGLGLPIGPEACAVLSNIFLKSVDDRIERLGAMHLRYGDDILLFGSNRFCRQILSSIEQELARIGLELSAEKTIFFDDPLEAIKSLRDGKLASLGELLRQDRPSGMDAVRRAFHDDIFETATPEPFKFRWIIKTLTYQKDPYGCASLAHAVDLMNIDPKWAAEYLIMSRFHDPIVVDGVMNRLMGAATDRLEGLDLHLLRAMSTRAFGEAEAKVFKNIAIDPKRHWPIRSWAWQAYTRSSKQENEVMEAAREESNPSVRRTIVLSLRPRARRVFLRHVADNFPECRYAVRWMMAA
jgi:Reverse transcriptase (RNA-dependent DNA polymerase)